MCKGPRTTSSTSNEKKHLETPSSRNNSVGQTRVPLSASQSSIPNRKRRSQRDRNSIPTHCDNVTVTKRKKKSKHGHRHDSASSNHASHNIIVTLLPSLLAVGVAVFALMARMGFRGRATVAGIDLGTTNSVICVQAPSKSVGKIVCLRDPLTLSPIIPSIVSFPSEHEKYHPNSILVGQAAKNRIETHPHSTIYHAKRIIGLPYQHPAVSNLQNEVSFQITEDPDTLQPQFDIPSTKRTSHSPATIGSHILKHLLTICAAAQSQIPTKITSAVVTIPAEFTPEQRKETILAYKQAGIKVARIIEEPTAAALAYGLDKKDNVEFVLVYDFGGGTLDVSILRISNGGYVDVMGSRGDGRLGGVDFDEGIVNHFLGIQNVVKDMDLFLKSRNVNEEDIKRECDADVPLCTLGSLFGLAENMKIALSDYDKEDGTVQESCLAASPSFSIDAQTANLCSQFTKHNLTLSKAQFRTVSEKLFQRSALPIRNLLVDLDLLAEDIDEVVMVGGTTRMPQIREIVKKELRKEVLNTEIDPDLTVAWGAASVID